MKSISKYNKKVRFSLYVIDIFSKYVWFVILQKILGEFGCKKNKRWLDEGGNFYKRSMKPWLQDNDINFFNAHWRKICCC